MKKPALLVGLLAFALLLTVGSGSAGYRRNIIARHRGEPPLDSAAATTAAVAPRTPPLVHPQVTTVPFEVEQVALQVTPLPNSGTTRAPDTTTVVPSGATTKVHCIRNVSPQDGSAVLLELAASRVTFNERLVYFLTASNETHFRDLVSQINECLHAPSVRRSTRLYLPYELHDFLKHRTSPGPFEVKFLRATEAERCSDGNWSARVMWHVPRVYQFSPYHFIFERGVLQAFLQFQAMRASDVGESLPPVVFNVAWDLAPRSADPSSRSAPAYGFLEAAVPHAGYNVGYSDPSSTVSCDRLSTFGYWYWAPMRYSYTTYLLEPWQAQGIQRFAATVAARFIERFGDARLQSAREVLWNEEAMKPFDMYGRARGIEPGLLASILGGILEGLPGTAAVDSLSFQEAVPLREQFLAIRSHRVFVSGEGAFFSWMLVAPRWSTWIMVYNHTRGDAEWKHSSYHTAVASALDVRLVIYVIDNGRAANVHELVALAMEKPWERGVHYIGANARGNRRA